MSVIDNLIYDRTQTDVDRLKELSARGWAALSDSERSEWLASKGGYNASDLNRVEEAVGYVANELNDLFETLINAAAEYGVSWDSDWLSDPACGELTIKIDWQANDIPNNTALVRYLSNINAVNTIGIDVAIPTSMQYLRYTGANAIEYLLYLIDAKIAELIAENADRAERMSKAWFFAGDVYGGELI